MSQQVPVCGFGLSGNPKLVPLCAHSLVLPSYAEPRVSSVGSSESVELQSLLRLFLVKMLEVKLEPFSSAVVSLLPNSPRDLVQGVSSEH